MRRTNARPAWIDKLSLRNFTFQLTRKIVTWASMQDELDRPIENAGNVAAQLFYFENDDGRTTKTVLVRVKGEQSTIKGTACLGGRFTANGIVVYLNGALTPNDLMSDERTQSMPNCTYETCIQYGIYSLLVFYCMN